MKVSEACQLRVVTITTFKYHIREALPESIAELMTQTTPEGEYLVRATGTDRARKVVSKTVLRLGGLFVLAAQER